MKTKALIASGKRKTAVATATLKKGSGRVFVNNKPLDTLSPALYALRMKEPLILAGADASKVDISVNVKGGGIAAQSDAVRLAIGKVLALHNKKLEDVFAKYDRTLLVADVRRKEPKKPNTRGSARSKRQKSYR